GPFPAAPRSITIEGTAAAPAAAIELADGQTVRLPFNAPSLPQPVTIRAVTGKTSRMTGPKLQLSVDASPGTIVMAEFVREHPGNVATALAHSAPAVMERVSASGRLSFRMPRVWPADR